MIALLDITKARGWAVLPAVLLLVACQSLSTDRAPAVSLSGEKTSERYAYMNSAINDLSLALETDEANFENIEFSHELFGNPDNSTQTEQQQQENRLRYLAENLLAARGQYNFLHADTHNNRIEFRSSDANTRHHLSVSIQPGTHIDSDAGSRYVVADMFAQVSLKDLSDALPAETTGIEQRSMTLMDVPLMRVVTQTELDTDSSLLDYFNNLPPAERDREDILRLRAMLALKIDQKAEASALIESGIVRFPDNPSFYVMAEHLISKSGKPTGDMADSLKTIIDHKFSAATFSKNRELLEEFLGT